MILVANGNAILQYMDDTCVTHADGTLYNFNILTGATYKIQTAINTNRYVVDYVNSYSDFFD